MSKSITESLRDLHPPMPATAVESPQAASDIPLRLTVMIEDKHVKSARWMCETSPKWDDNVIAWSILPLLLDSRCKRCGARTV